MTSNISSNRNVYLDNNHGYASKTSNNPAKYDSQPILNDYVIVAKKNDIQDDKNHDFRVVRLVPEKSKTLEALHVMITEAVVDANKKNLLYRKYSNLELKMILPIIKISKDDISQGSIYIAIDSEEHILGTGELVYETGQIRRMFVHPKYQGRGIGKAIIRNIEKEASKIQLARIFLECPSSRATFYTSCGFEVSEIEFPKFFPNSVAMKKNLNNQGNIDNSKVYQQFNMYPNKHLTSNSMKSIDSIHNSILPKLDAESITNHNSISLPSSSISLSDHKKNPNEILDFNIIQLHSEKRDVLEALYTMITESVVDANEKNLLMRRYTDLELKMLLPIAKISSEDISQCDIYVAVDSEKHILGTGEIVLGNGHVRRMFVHPKCQGHGIGRAIMLHIEESAIKNSLTSMFLECPNSQIPFYERCGFHVGECDVPKLFPTTVAMIKTIVSDPTTIATSKNKNKKNIIADSNIITAINNTPKTTTNPTISTVATSTSTAVTTSTISTTTTTVTTTTITIITTYAFNANYVNRTNSIPNTTTSITTNTATSISTIHASTSTVTIIIAYDTTITTTTSTAATNATIITSYNW